ncbi:MAG: M1 family metallopeptidase [Deltaproteobacteria bacterium]|nr:M1 family metallopeptidase [Deltaproteobacteria bacterium]
MSAAKPHRLPTHVLPRRYSVSLKAQPEASEFSGHVTMSLEVVRTTGAIEMHARELGLAGAKVTVGGDVLPATIELSPETQTVRFKTERDLPKGEVRLEVDFSGKLSPNLHGIYLATDGSTRAVCTQCEATDARAIFPCFDEPEFKAELEWTIRTPEGLLALANGPLSEVVSEGGERVWRFLPTRPVSSYLAALVVGDFEASDQKVVRGIPLRLFSPKGKRAQTKFGLDFTARCIPWFEDYFGVPYAFSKYDQVAVPGFDAGAMENVGLVLFRQNLLLMDPATASWRQEKLVAKVIAHEMAHMWFGNLVTMSWWDDLWLNEAFAEWIAHKAVHALVPGYDVWSDFHGDKSRALADDALPTTHSIWTDVETPDQALEMFDAITYQKGCAVMRMLENFLGEDPFRDGLRRYMTDFGGRNAKGMDLWQRLEASSSQPVGKLMSTWVGQPGFPVVRARLVGSTLELSQRRCFSSPELVAKGSDQVWPVPLVIRFADDEGVKTHRYLLEGSKGTTVLPVVGEVSWCYPNADEIGFYRVDFDDSVIERVLANVTKLSPVEQVGLVSDQWALVRNGSISIDRFLPLLEALCESGADSAPISDHNVLRVVVERLGALDHLVRDAGADAAGRDRARQARAALWVWITALLGPSLDSLGLESRAGETQNDVQRRPLLFHALGRIARRRDVISASETASELERNDSASVDPNLAGTCIAIAARFGDAARYQLWVETYLARRSGGASPQATLRYLYTLGEFHGDELVRRTLDHLEDGTIAQESVGVVLGQLLSSRHSEDLAWTHTKGTWAELRKRVGDMGLSRLVEAVGALSPSHRRDVVAFFDRNPPAGAERALMRALQRMDEGAELARRVTPKLLARFSAA